VIASLCKHYRVCLYKPEWYKSITQCGLNQEMHEASAYIIYHPVYNEHKEHIIK
jgi:hypothetical protein